MTTQFLTRPTGGHGTHQHFRLRRSVLDVTDDLACLQLSIVNVVFHGRAGAGDREWVLVDAGLATSTHRIVEAAAERYGPDSRPAAIVLTHGHFDHVGAIYDLVERWDVPVYAHRLEMPYLTGRSSYPPPDSAVGGGAMALMAPLYPRGPIDLGENVRELPDDQSVPHMPGWRWVHTPGHTAGHVSLFRDKDRALIAGDAFVTTKQESMLWVMTQMKQVRRPPAYYTTDWDSARASVRRLADLEPQIAITGHGLPMTRDELRQQLHRLADEFRQWIPAYGRYVHEPAVTDERGVVSVPPAQFNPRHVAFAGVGALIAGLLLVRGARRD